MNIKEQIKYSPRESWQFFNQISGSYDLLNHVLSFGMDSFWRKALCRHVPQRQVTLLDLATGTGDVLLTLLEQCPQIKKAHGIDLAENMLAIAQKKTQTRELMIPVEFKIADAQELPFIDQSMDVVTMAFGIRNVENPILVLKEIYRVLKPKGKAMILEFSLPSNFLLKALDVVYLRSVVPLLGGLVSGNFAAYRYLNKTIEKFPYGERFCRMLEQVGLKQSQAIPLFGGVASIYLAEKV